MLAKYKLVAYTVDGRKYVTADAFELTHEELIEKKDQFREVLIESNSWLTIDNWVLIGRNVSAFGFIENDKA